MKTDTPYIMKTCNVCGKDFRTRTRQRRYCDVCQKIKNREGARKWAVNHAEEYREHQRIWMANHAGDRQLATMDKNGTDHWEFHGRKLPMGDVRRLVSDGCVDGLRVEWHGHTYEARRCNLVEVT